MRSWIKTFVCLSILGVLSYAGYGFYFHYKHSTAHVTIHLFNTESDHNFTVGIFGKEVELYAVTSEKQFERIDKNKRHFTDENGNVSFLHVPTGVTYHILTPGVTSEHCLTPSTRNEVFFEKKWGEITVHFFAQPQECFINSLTAESRYNLFKRLLLGQF